jgi:UDP-N-acetylmuramoyl-L-alanyl-D-glutamate--2,6-diaminopimelate ligase
MIFLVSTRFTQSYFTRTWREKAFSMVRYNYQLGEFMDHSIALSELFNQPYFHLKPELPDITIKGITSDSRRVQPGSLFIAIRGESYDGHQFISDAIDRGASAVVGGKPGIKLKIPYIFTPDSRQALPYLAAAFYGFPARKLTVIGVTGTDGKTTTTNLIYRILLSAGIKAGMVSTVNAVIGEKILDTGFHVTTPEAFDVQEYLSQMVLAGLTHVVLETTSHGLAQYRVDACEFDLAVVTNITHEHLDYHGSYEAYRAAKTRLFEMLNQTVVKPHGNLRVAILNQGDGSFPYLTNFMAQFPQVRTISYGLSPQADVWAEGILQDSSGLRFDVNAQNNHFEINSGLMGLYNVSNCLAAVAATVSGLGIAFQYAQQGISDLAGIPGRMERIQMGQNFISIVDFAHTPNALRVSLEAVRKMTQGRVIAVFGSAGLRDREKRRLMAETSIKLANITILTAEDPRTESLEDILAEMAAGAFSQGGEEEKTFWRIQDRGKAIRFAISLTQPGDVVIACGKGHEQSMCFGKVEYPWDDRVAMQAALAEILGISGPKMPELPTS